MFRISYYEIKPDLQYALCFLFLAFYLFVFLSRFIDNRVSCHIFHVTSRISCLFRSWSTRFQLSISSRATENKIQNKTAKRQEVKNITISMSKRHHKDVF